MVLHSLVLVCCMGPTVSCLDTCWYNTLFCSTGLLYCVTLGTWLYCTDCLVLVCCTESCLYTWWHNTAFYLRYCFMLYHLIYSVLHLLGLVHDTILYDIISVFFGTDFYFIYFSFLQFFSADLLSIYFADFFVSWTESISWNETIDICIGFHDIFSFLFSSF